MMIDGLALPLTQVDVIDVSMMRERASVIVRIRKHPAATLPEHQNVLLSVRGGHSCV
jgi:hypothetical protein